MVNMNVNFRHRKMRHPLPGPKSAVRRVALQLLASCQEAGGQLREALHHQDFADLSLADRALAYEISGGALRTQNTLGWMLKPFLKRDPPTRLGQILHLSAYQLVFLDRVPVHAIIHEGTALAREEGGEKGASFVHAVLQNLNKRLGKDRDWLRAGWVSPRALELKGWEFPRDLTVRLAFAYSHPEWLVGRWLKLWGRSQTELWLTAGNQRLYHGVRVNPLRSAKEAVKTQFRERPGNLIDLGEPHFFLWKGRGYPGDFPAFRDGSCSFQDLVQFRVGLLMDPRPGERVLDFCAGLGSKTTHLAELMKNEGRIDAWDIAPDRLDLLEASRARLGLTNITRCLAPPTDGAYDQALLDVPCSNTGVLARRPEVRWRLSETEIDRLREVQQGLLEQTRPLVKPGGKICYATCTLEPEENEHQVSTFLARHPDFRLLVERSYHPSSCHGGGYAALLARDGS